MGSSKKKDKKKKKKRSQNSDNESPTRNSRNFSVDEYPSLEEHYQGASSASNNKRSSYVVEDSRSHKSRSKDDYYEDKDNSYRDGKRRERSGYNKNIPETEEYVYDYSGQEMIHGSRDMSISPEGTNENTDSEVRPRSSKESYNEPRRTNYSRKRDSYHDQSPGVSSYSRSDQMERSRSPARHSKKELTPPPLPPGMDWPFEASKSPEERNRDRNYQDDVESRNQEKQRESKRRTGSYQVSVSPERTNENTESKESYNGHRRTDYIKKRDSNHDRSPGASSYSRSDQRERSRSPVRHSKKELTPPPLPPGMDWPFEAPRVPIRPKSPPSNYDDSAWKMKEERNRDRDYQDDVDRKYKEKQRESNRRTG